MTPKPRLLQSNEETMTQSSSSHNTLAPLRNVLNFTKMMHRLEDRSHGLAGMGCFYGPSGFGKTMASIYAANTRQACLVQVKSVWTQKALCEAILAELGAKPEKVIYRMVDQIGQILVQDNRPLLIDEADFLVKKKMIEIVRDIYEVSGVPVVMIGEEKLPTKLQQWERINSRMLERVAAEPLDHEDFALLMGIRCNGISVTEDLQEAIKAAARGSARLMVNNLDTARLRAELEGVRTVSLKELPVTDLHTGLAPSLRRFS